MLGSALLDLLEGGDASALVEDIAAALSATAPKALERSAALLVWKGQWESDAAASRHGGDRRSATFRTSRDQGAKFSFCSMAAQAIGMSERAVQLDVALAEQLGPADIRRLWQSPIHDNAAALRTVAALGAEARASLFGVWTTRPGLAFGPAMRAARLRQEQDSDEASFARMIDAWTRAGSKARRRFLDEIGFGPAEAAAVIARWRKRGAET